MAILLCPNCHIQITCPFCQEPQPGVDELIDLGREAVKE